MDPQPDQAPTVTQLNTQDEKPESPAIAYKTTPAHPNADNNVLLVIGEDETRMFVPKDRLATIPFFDRMFASPYPFQESIENKVTLPEDDADLWRRAEEFLRTGDFHPRFVVDEPGQKTTPHCLEVPLLVVDDDGTLVPWTDTAWDLFGTETVSKGTHDMLEELLFLFRLGDKYFWADLMDECVLKIALFPMGRREYAMVSEHCYRLHALPYRHRDGEADQPGMINFSLWEDYPAGKGDAVVSKRRLAWMLDHFEQNIALGTRMRSELWPRLLI